MRSGGTPLSLAERHQHYLEAATAENTRRTYRAALRHFERAGGLLPATEASVMRYLLDHAAILSPQTLSLRLTALRQWHRYQGFPDPTATPEVRKTLTGIFRLHGRPPRKAKALRMEQLETLIAHLADQGENLKAVRDRALLLVGFFGAFRRSELVGVQVADLSWEPEGVVIRLSRSKSDQTGAGMFKALPVGGGPLCPVAALRHWLNLAGITEGAVFRPISRWGGVQPESLAPASVNLVLKAAAEAAGLDIVPELSGHSLRRSLATNAHRARASFEAIKRQGGWRHDGTVWEYIEEAKRFKDNAAAVLLARRGDKGG